MTTSSVYYLHGIRIQTAALPTYVDITQLTEGSPANNLIDFQETPAGQTAPFFSASQGAVPDVTATTRQLKAFLDIIDTEGIAFDASGFPVDLFYKAGDSHGTRIADATLSHIRARMDANALIYWTGFRASQNGEAELSFRVLPVWDGSNNPLVVTGSVALAGTSTASHTYTLGRIDLNGTDVSAVQDIDWQNNIEPEEVASDGEEFLSYGGIRSFAPSFTFRTRDTAVLATYGAKGTALTSFEVYLRKRSAGSINVADATAEHIKLNNASASGVIKARRATGLDGVAEVAVFLNKPAAATDPFAISTASAIT